MDQFWEPFLNKKVKIVSLMRQVAPRWSPKKGFERERKDVENCMNISWKFGAKKGGVKVELPCDKCCKLGQFVGFEIS